MTFHPTQESVSWRGRHYHLEYEIRVRARGRRPHPADRRAAGAGRSRVTRQYVSGWRRAGRMERWVLSHRACRLGVIDATSNGTWMPRRLNGTPLDLDALAW